MTLDIKGLKLPAPLSKTVRLFRAILIDPFREIMDPAERNRTRLLTLLILAVALLQLAATLVTPPTSNAMVRLYLLGNLINLAAYLTCRLSYPRTAALIWAFNNSTVTLASIVLGISNELANVGLYFLVFSLVLPSLASSMLSMAVVGIYNLAGILILPWLSIQGFPSLASVFMPLAFNLAALVAGIGNNYYQKYIETLRGKALTESETALNESNALNEQIISESPIGISIYDNTGQCIAVNESMAEIAGATRNDLLALNYHDMDSWKKAGMYNLAQQAIQEQRNQRMEFHTMTHFGKEVHVDNVLAPFFVNGKQYLLLMSSDISESRMMQETLEQNEKLLARAQQVAHLGYWRVNVETSSVSGSNILYELFELPQSDLLVGDFLEKIHPDDQARVMAGLDQAIKTGRGWEVKFRVNRSSDEFRWVFGIGEATLDSTGKVVELFGTSQDVTEQERDREELNTYRTQLEQLVQERTEELRLANAELVKKERLATLGQLTATVSHELRNPLGAMRPSLYLLQKCIDTDNPKLSAALNRLDRNIQRCDHIIDELLDFTRAQDLQLEPVEMNDWLRDLLSEQDFPDGLTVEERLSPEKVYIKADRHRLRRALINVIDNANQAMMEPEATGPKPVLTLSTQLEDARIAIHIRDNGPGIREEDLPHIFEPLFSTKAFGVGLGMPTVKKIIEELDGEISIDTHIGDGTTVTLWLPVEAATS